MAAKKSAAAKKKAAAPKKASSKASKSSKSPAARSRWDKRWIGRELHIVLVDDTVIIGTLREVDTWSFCIDLSDDSHSEVLIPRDCILFMEYDPAGYADWYTEDDDMDVEVEVTNGLPSTN